MLSPEPAGYIGGQGEATAPTFELENPYRYAISSHGLSKGALTRISQGSGQRRSADNCAQRARQAFLNRFERPQVVDRVRCSVHFAAL